MTTQDAVVDYIIKAGDNRPIFERQLLNDGAALDLTTATDVRLIVTTVTGTELLNITGLDIVGDPTAGNVRWSPTALEVADLPAGRHLAELEVTYPATVITVPNDGYLIFEVEADLDGAAPLSLLATPRDLALYLRRPELETDAGVLELLTLLSGRIRDRLEQTITLVADDDFELVGDGSDVLFLPELPVVEVSAVTITPYGGSAEALTAGTDYRLELGRDSRVGILRRLPRGLVWTRDAVVEGTYTHGYATTPPGLKLIVCRIAARAVTNPAGNRQETIGRYSYTAETVGSAISAADLEDLEDYRAGVHA